VSTFLSALGLDAKDFEGTVAKGLFLKTAYYTTNRSRDASQDALSARFRGFWRVEPRERTGRTH